MYGWIEEIDNYNAILSSQNIPRDHVSKGLDLPIYRRCGWESPTLESEKAEVAALGDSLSCIEPTSDYVYPCTEHKNLQNCLIPIFFFS